MVQHQSQRLRSTVPTTAQQLKSQIVDPKLINDKLKCKQKQQKSRYDIEAHQLPPVEKGEKVRLQIRDQWQPATAVEEANTLRFYYQIEAPSGETGVLMKTSESQAEIPTRKPPEAASQQRAPQFNLREKQRSTEQTDIQNPSVSIRTSSGGEIRRPQKLLG